MNAYLVGTVLLLNCSILAIANREGLRKSLVGFPMFVMFVTCQYSPLVSVTEMKKTHSNNFTNEWRNCRTQFYSDSVVKADFLANKSWGVLWRWETKPDNWQPLYVRWWIIMNFFFFHFIWLCLWFYLCLFYKLLRFTVKS